MSAFSELRWCAPKALRERKKYLFTAKTEAFYNSQKTEYWRQERIKAIQERVSFETSEAWKEFGLKLGIKK